MALTTEPISTGPATADRFESVFVSHCHSDARLVVPVVGLLRGTKKLVFLDSESIQPGQKWRDELTRSLKSARLFVLFWCRHSFESPELEKEYRAALAGQKVIIPVLLDSTPLPEALAEFHYSDFREVVRYAHSDVWRTLDWVKWASVAAVVIALGTFLVTPIWTSDPPFPKPTGGSGIGSEEVTLVVAFAVAMWAAVKLAQATNGFDSRTNVRVASR